MATMTDLYYRDCTVYPHLNGLQPLQGKDRLDKVHPQGFHRADYGGFWVTHIQADDLFIVAYTDDELNQGQMDDIVRKARSEVSSK